MSSMLDKPAFRSEYAEITIVPTTPDPEKKIDGDGGWGFDTWIKVISSVVAVISAVVLYVKQLCRIDNHTISQEDDDADVLCIIEAESFLNRLHASTSQKPYIPLTQLSHEQKLLIERTHPSPTRKCSTFWTLVTQLKMKLTHKSSFDFNTTTILHSSFRIRAFRMTRASDGSLEHMGMQAEKKRLYRTDGGKIFGRPKPSLVFRKDGIYDSRTKELSRYLPIPLEYFTEIDSSFTRQQQYVDPQECTQLAVTDFTDTVVVIHPEQAENLPGVSSEESQDEHRDFSISPLFPSSAKSKLPRETVIKVYPEHSENLPAVSSKEFSLAGG